MKGVAVDWGEGNGELSDDPSQVGVVKVDSMYWEWGIEWWSSLGLLKLTRCIGNGV